MNNLISDPSLTLARTRLRGTGARVTPARVRVLAVLMEAGQPLSHHEVEQILSPAAELDRVTLYRVLDWLVQQRLAHRVAGSDRAWRFSVAGDQPSLEARGGLKAGGAKVMHERHAHFHCNDCGKVYCLDSIEAKALNVPVPIGYRPETLELTVKGYCAHCN